MPDINKGRFLTGFLILSQDLISEVPDSKESVFFCIWNYHRTNCVVVPKLSVELAEKFFERERIEKIFSSKEIETWVGYVEDDNFVCVMHNKTIT